MSKEQQHLLTIMQLSNKVMSLEKQLKEYEKQINEQNVIIEELKNKCNSKLLEM